MNIREPLSNGRLNAPLKGALVSCAILLCLMLVVLIPLAWWGSANYGSMGLVASISAWSLCTAAALLALVVSVGFAGTEHAMSANLGMMLVRMGVPLAGLTFLPESLPQLKAAGFVPCLLISYLLALVVETALAVRHVVPTGVLPHRGSTEKSARA